MREKKDNVALEGLVNGHSGCETMYLQTEQNTEESTHTVERLNCSLPLIHYNGCAKLKERHVEEPNALLHSC